MKAVVGAFNQEKALEEAFSVIVKTDCGTDESFYSTSPSVMTIAPRKYVASRNNAADIVLIIHTS